MSHYEVWDKAHKMLGNGKTEAVAVERACHTLSTSGFAKEWTEATLLEDCGRGISVTKPCWLHPDFNGSHAMGQS